MNIKNILQTIGEILTPILDILKKFAIWLLSVIQTSFEWAIQSVSSWFSSLSVRLPMTKIFANDTVNAVIFFLVLSYIVIINIAAFIMYGTDKKRSKKKKVRRIPESKLIKVCVFGGAAGGFIGMLLFHHKTQHTKFKIIVPTMFVIQLILDSLILGFLGFWAFF